MIIYIVNTEKNKLMYILVMLMFEISVNSIHGEEQPWVSDHVFAWFLHLGLNLQGTYVPGQNAWSKNNKILYYIAYINPLLIYGKPLTSPKFVPACYKERSRKNINCRCWNNGWSYLRRRRDMLTYSFSSHDYFSLAFPDFSLFIILKK